jgi:hypothetical protein
VKFAVEGLEETVEMEVVMPGLEHIATGRSRME